LKFGKEYFEAAVPKRGEPKQAWVCIATLARQMRNDGRGGRANESPSPASYRIAYLAEL
jgi:hypothetical protein